MNESEELIVQIDEMIAEETWDDDFIAPSPEVVSEAKALIAQVDNVPPGGFVATAGGGDIAIEWNGPSKTLSLNFNSSRNYIWHKQDYKGVAEHGSCTMTVDELKKWFAWFVDA